MALSLKKQIENIINAKLDRALNEVSKLIPPQIKKRTQLGKDLSGSKLKDLKPSTKAYRKRYKANLDSNTTPTKSNLTATGQLLNAIECEVKGRQFELSLKDQRKNDLSGSKSKVKNSEIRKFQEDQGRPFFGLLEFEKLFIIREIIKRLK